MTKREKAKLLRAARGIVSEAFRRVELEMDALMCPKAAEAAVRRAQKGRS